MYRAVIADDEPFMLEGMRLMIDWARCGFELCGEAATAQEALRLIDTRKPHLLITDVRMPGMLGTDLAAIVNRYHPDVTVLFFSGYRDFTYAQAAIRTHAFGYLLKPIDVEEVEATLLKVKAELDTRASIKEARKIPVLRDQVLNRIALGDESPESMLRAGALLSLQKDDPCYCAVLVRERDAIPEAVGLMLSAYSAIPFLLSPTQVGMVFRQVERDLPALSGVLAGLSQGAQYRLSVGGVYSGPQGFARSLREALDAQGVLFETHGGLLLYRPFDKDVAAWLARFRPSDLASALTDENPEALEAALSSLRQAVAEFHPSRFSLRWMAAALDAMLPTAAAVRSRSPLCALWRNETQESSAWLDTFCEQLRSMRGVVKLETGDGWPAAVQATVAAIRTRYAEPLCIGTVADELHMNSAYLGQIVRRYTGATFHRRLQVTRIEHACLLLRQTMRSVGEIAMEVGFKDVDYFSRQFHSRMGISPVAYRGAEASREDCHAPN